MELNKRKSLLTPAAPTVWGMIHGDISQQTDIVERITEEVNEAVGSDLSHRIESEVLAIVNPIVGEIEETTQPRLVSGENIMTLKGRSLLGEGDLDPLDAGDRMLLETIETKADRSTTYTKTEVDELIGGIREDLSDYATESYVETSIETVESKISTNYATKEEMQNLIEEEVWGAKYTASEAKNIALTADDKVDKLQIYVDEQIGDINTITEDILS